MAATAPQPDACHMPCETSADTSVGLRVAMPHGPSVRAALAQVCVGDVHCPTHLVTMRLGNALLLVIYCHRARRSGVIKTGRSAPRVMVKENGLGCVACLPILTKPMGTCAFQQKIEKGAKRAETPGHMFLVFQGRAPGWRQPNLPL